MNSLIKALALFCLLVSSLQAKHFDHEYKSAFKHKKHHLAKIIHKVKKKIHEHKKCGNITAKSLRDLKKSKKIQIAEDESSIEITSSCPITLLPKFEFDQDKILVISAPDLKIQNHAEINATRIILNIADKLDIKKHAKLCAEVIVLEAPRGCPDNEELSATRPAPPSYTVDMEVLCHDYAAETDMTYTNSCTFN